MWLYLLIFFVVVALASSATTKEQQQSSFMLSMIFLAVFVGLADMLGGYDRYIYGEAFDRAVDTMWDGGDIFDTDLVLMYGGEFGYCAWNFLIGFITRNRYIFIFLSTLLMYYFFYKALKRQTDNPMFALVLFMALTFYFSFTYIRQMMATAFVWQALQYVEKRNLKKFCFWVFVAFSFHNSAIIMFPLYFIAYKKFELKWVNYAMFACFILGASGFSSAVFNAYNSLEEARANAVGYAFETGIRWSYIVEALFFYYFIRKYYQQLGQDSSSLVGLNMSVIFCCILLLFMKSENGGRLGWFYMIGLYSLSTNIFTGVHRLARPALIIIVSFLLYFRVTYLWGENGFQILYPYKTFLTPGVRQPDNCHAKYEYDFKYDSDKFYR